MGREAEIAGLISEFAQARESGGRVVLIAGEAGSGKTTLIDHFLTTHTDGHPVLAGGCIEFTAGELPFAAITEALAGYLQTVDDPAGEKLVGPNREELSWLMPQLGHASASEPSGLARGRLFEAVLSFLERLGNDRLPIVAIEDVHWWDASTADLVTFLIRNLRRSPVFLILSYRTDELPRRHPRRLALAQLARHPAVVRSTLGPLDRASVARQLETLTASVPSREEVDRIYALSNGNPLFVEELSASHGGALPTDIRESFLGRVDRLSPEGVALLRALAVAGGVAPIERLAAVTETAADLVPAAIEDAQAHHLISNTEGGEVVRFRHPLIGEVLYSETIAGERVALHRAHAEALEARLDTGVVDLRDAVEIAQHWTRAGAVLEAFGANLRTAEAAAKRHAYAVAARQLERAAGLWTQVHDAEGIAGRPRHEVLRTAAEYYSLGGSAPDAVRAVEAAIALIDVDRQPALAGVLHERLGRYRWTSGDGSGSRSAYERALELVPKDPPSTERARVLASHGQILMLQGSYAAAVTRCEEAIALAKGLKDGWAEAHALNTLGPALGFLGDVPRSLAALEKARAISASIADAEGIGRSLVNAVTILDADGRPGESLELAQNGLTDVQGLGLASSYGVWLQVEILLRLSELGRWDEARALGEELSKGDVAGYAELVHLALAQIAARRGHDALDRLAALKAEAPTWSSIEFEVPLNLAIAEAALMHDDIEMARGALDEGFASADAADDMLYTSMLCSFGFMIEGSAKKPAPERLADLRARTAKLHDSDLGAVRANVVLCDAERTRVEGTSDPERWQLAGDVWREIGNTYLESYCRIRHAEALLAAGARDPARELLEEVTEVLDALGAAPLADQARGVARRGRLAIGEAPEEGVPRELRSLTEREREVLRLVAEGKSNPQIAEELFISVKTASVHVSRILSKMGVSTRGEAGSVAYRSGLMGPST